MGRLIDADVMQRQAFLDNFDGKINDGMLFAVNRLIEHAQTVDAVPVIQCKDCKYWSTETEQTAVPNMHKCTWWRTIGTLPIDFCPRAERRGEE